MVMLPFFFVFFFVIFGVGATPPPKVKAESNN